MALARLIRADAICTNFSGATLQEADLTKANLSRADLRASLDKADFTKAILRSADFTLANLTDADFTKADLSDAINLTTANRAGVVWDDTICPDGTNSGAAALGGTCEGHLGTQNPPIFDIICPEPPPFP